MKGWTALRRLLLRGRSLTRRRVVIGLDFDGTLSPFVRVPARARLPQRLRRVLERLARRPRVRLAVISGRSLKDVKSKVPLRGVHFAGNHGLEIEGPGLAWRHPEAGAAAGDVRALARELSAKLRPLPGVLLENKGLSLSVHFRRARPADRPKIRGLLVGSLRPYRNRLSLTPGKMVWDVRPNVSCNKGHALLKIAGPLGRNTSLLFVGDDRTDEEGFRMLGRKALTVRVGPAAQTAARFLIENRAQVYPLLSFLDKAIP